MYIIELDFLVFCMYIPRSGIAGSYGNFRFLRSLYTVFPDGFTDLLSHQQYKTGPPFSTYSPTFVI